MCITRPWLELSGDLSFYRSALPTAPQQTKHRNKSVKIRAGDAKGKIRELDRAEAGADVGLANEGQDVIAPSAIARPKLAGTRRRILEEISAIAAAKASPGPDAARSQDFLYCKDGLAS